MLPFKNLFSKHSKVVVVGFWIGFLSGILIFVIGVNTLPLYTDPSYPFVRFHAINSSSNQMFLTARMVKELAAQKMVGKKRLILILGDSILRGHGNAQDSSFGPQLADLLANENTGVLNLSRDGYSGPKIFSIHRYLLKIYPDTYLVTVMANHIVGFTSQMELQYIDFDLFSSNPDLSTNRFKEKSGEFRFSEMRYIAMANRYFGFLDFGQAFRYHIAQLFYTSHVRYEKIKMNQAIKAVPDGEIDYLWYRENPNYTDQYIDAEVNYWRKFSEEPFQPLEWDQYFESVSPDQWKRVVLVEALPVPFLRQQMMDDFSQLENALSKFENYFKSKRAHIVSSVVLKENNEYADMLHWSKDGASRMVAQVADELCSMYQCDKSLN